MLSPLAALVAPLAPIRIGAVDLVPLVARRPLVLPVLDLLDEALRSGHTSITEVDDSGIVGEVLVRHGGATPLLILDGEEIVGAKQNRTFNGSFLVSPGTEVRLPVSCVERGRWQHRGGMRFGSTSRTVAPAVRGEKVRKTAMSLCGTGTFAGDQSAVWDRVREYTVKGRTHSSTESLADAMAPQLAANELAIEALPILPAQIGLAAVAGDRLLGADIVGSPAIYARLHHKLARGFAAELHDGPASTRSALEIVGEALASVASATQHRRFAAGGGTTIVTQTRSVVATALVDGDTLVHSVVVPAA
jgi:hypothetical protein